MRTPPNAWPATAAAGQDGAVEAEGADAGRAGVGALDDAEHLRHHQRRPGALQQAARDQRAGRRGEAAQQRRDGEAGEPGLKRPAVAVGVAEAGAGDEEDRVGDGVAGDDELQAGAGGVRGRRGSTAPRR